MTVVMNDKRVKSQFGVTCICKGSLYHAKKMQHDGKYAASLLKDYAQYASKNHSLIDSDELQLLYDIMMFPTPVSNDKVFKNNTSNNRIQAYNIFVASCCARVDLIKEEWVDGLLNAMMNNSQLSQDVMPNAAIIKFVQNGYILQPSSALILGELQRRDDEVLDNVVPFDPHIASSDPHIASIGQLVTRFCDNLVNSGRVGRKP